MAPRDDSPRLRMMSAPLPPGDSHEDNPQGGWPSFGSQLRVYREGAGLSQAEAAKAAGIDQPTWSRYEADAWVPSLPRAVRLAHAVGADLDELVRGVAW